MPKDGSGRAKRKCQDPQVLLLLLMLSLYCCLHIPTRYVEGFRGHINSVPSMRYVLKQIVGTAKFCVVQGQTSETPFAVEVRPHAS